MPSLWRDRIIGANDRHRAARGCYTIAAHSHPTDQHVVITSGAITFGMGDKVMKGAAESTIILYGTGPVEFKYVNPADDPRTVKSSTRP